MDKYLDGMNRNSYYKKQKQKVEPLFKKQDLLEEEIKEKNLPNYLNSKIIDNNFNTKLDNLSKKIIKNNNKLIKINQKILLNHIQIRSEQPFNLLYYIKKRYLSDYLNTDSDTDNHTNLNNYKRYSFDTKDNNKLYLYVKIRKNNMKTSQHLLTKDKNYYLGEAFVNNNNLKLTNFRLQLNHVSKTLSIFKDKHNNDNRKKTENNKKTSSDW
ncbi:MAG: hypothetical protein Q8855_00285 [Candidatus Phytoplasma australasiaticum]|nr:hypothetical protein [Candidatus Phytoplasma australasiaticum]